MEEKLYDIWFSSLDIENETKLELLNKFNSIEVWNLDNEELDKIDILLKDKFTITRSKNLDYAKYAYSIMKKQEIELVSIRDNKYPKKLHQIEKRPSYIYVRGNIDILDDASVGIVGCRIATNLGKKMARSIAKELADRNINIISGLAIGIDKSAHLGALDSNIGKTVAILGCGITDDEVYPYENKKIFDRIINQGGTIISEYCIGSKPEKKHFPERNRIISGLSDKVIVVEAKKRSGSLITADWALEQGKDVYAIPGNLFTKNSVGTNNLIKEGAYLFSNIDDVLYSY